jgi:hypothetical protein
MAQRSARGVTALPDRRFYVGLSLALAATAFVGFAPTYYLGRWFAALPLPPLVQLHGALFSAWLALLVGQATLIAAGRRDWHRGLGLAGVALAAAMLAVGTLTAIASARRGFAPAGLEPLMFLVIPLASLALFAGFFGAAVVLRRRPELHRRLVVLATISILTPAIARLWFVHQRPVIALALTNVFVLAAIGYEYRRRGRVHPLYLWGGLVIVVSGPLRAALGRTALWHQFAAWLVG